jgi:outer membrane autotransporter protein
MGLALFSQYNYWQGEALVPALNPTVLQVTPAAWDSGSAFRPGSAQWLALDDGSAELRQGQTSLWFSPQYSYSRYHGTRAYDLKGPSLAVGIDHWVNDSFFLGLALGQDFPSFSSDDAEVDAHTTSGTIYAGVQLPQDWQLGLFVSLARVRYDQKRADPQVWHNNDFNGDTWRLGASLSLPLAVNESLLLRPFVSYEFLRNYVGARSEAGGTYALSFEAGENYLHQVEAGVDAALAVGGKAHLRGRVYYSGLYGDRESRGSISFSQDPQHKLYSPSALPLDEHSLGLAAGVSVQLLDSLELGLDYNFMAGEHSQSQQGMAGLRWRF